MPTHVQRPDQGESSGWLLALVAIAPAVAPLMVLANASEAPVLSTLAMAYLLWLMLALGIWMILKRIGLDALGSACAVALLVLALANTGSLVGHFHHSDRVALVVTALLIASVGYRLRDVKLFRALVTWFVLALLIYPVVTALSRNGVGGEVVVDAGSELEVSVIEPKPDILILIFDGYGSAPVLEEFYGYDNSPMLDQLADLGFHVPTGITANYAKSQLSIPSVLQLSYVADEGPITEADVRHLQHVVNGGSRLAQALRSQGYRHVYVESGWLGSRCGVGVDVCVEAPWPDETFFDVAYRSILRGMPGFELGRSFTEGALHVSDWLTGELETYLADDIPDFIFIHLLIPHPPLFLDAHCTPDWRGGQAGYAIGRMGFDEADVSEARAGYVEQVKCANRVALEVAALSDPEDAIIMMADHGPDSLGQLFVRGTEWSEAQRRERFGAFFAARVPDCDMSRIESLVNVGRRLLTCYTRTDLPDLPTRIYDLHKAPGGTTVHQLALPAS